MMFFRSCVTALFIISMWLFFLVDRKTTAHPVPLNTPNPTEISIPRLSIHAPVLPLGLTKTGAMDTPFRADQVGWFAPGAKPGTPGNAVMDGHLDTVSETHGVFWNLSKMSVGDDVYVKNSDDHTLHFRVRRMQSYPVATVPMQEIFGSSSGTHLNLITCNGQWDRTSVEYTKRLVVFTDLVP